MLAQHLAARDVNADQAWRAKTMVAMIYRPKPVLLVYDDAKDRIEQLKLQFDIRERHRSTVDVFQQPIARSACVRMHGKEDSSVSADRNVADRFRVFEHGLDLGVAEHRCRRHVRIGIAATVSNPCDGSQKNKKD